MNLSVMKKRHFKTGRIRSFTALATLATAAVFLAGNAGAEPPTATDIVAEAGCAMAHCDQGLTDDNHLAAALSGEIDTFWRDTAVNGSFIGLGCVANSFTAVCSFNSSSSKPVEIRSYAIDGAPLWSSTAFSGNTYYSAPMIGPDGGVIAADERNIIRFGPDGEQIWSQSTLGGSQVRPNVTDDGHIILAPTGGPIAAYDFDSGELIAQLTLNDTVQLRRRTISGFFDTINNSAIKGNRIYLSTRFTLGRWPLRFGRLYAVDLVQNPVLREYSFEIAWFYNFRAPSGSSPTLGSDAAGNTIIYFDGSGVTPSSTSNPVALAIRDLGDSGQLLWDYQLSTVPQASPTLDPRGGIWYFAFGDSDLVRLDNNNGENIQTINVNDIVDDANGTFRPYSVMTVSIDVDTANPVGIVAATSQDNSITYIIAIDLATEDLLWKYRIDEGTGFNGGTSGQYAMLINDQGQPVVVFSTRQNGVWGLVVGESEQ